ncbi:MAG: tetratricopeptide repeat protein [Moorea sp. SIO2B7]|nr:tetratricopeptide repeat protein [Moorena sp. SIO2B7]
MQLDYCWRNWEQGDKLLIIDNVTDYKQQVEAYLPPDSSEFKILLISQEDFGLLLPQLKVTEFNLDTSIELLKSLINPERVDQEIDIAEKICQKLGYLPLALESVGTLLYNDQDLSLTILLNRLENNGLGIESIFEDSWDKLSEKAQKLGCLLSLFALADFPGWLVKSIYSHLYSSENGEIYLDDLEEAISELLRFNLLQRRNKEIYNLNCLIRDFFKSKLESLINKDEIKQCFVDGMVTLVKQFPEFPIREQIKFLFPVVINLKELVEDKNLIKLISNDDIILPFANIGHFYEAQGLYDKVEPWYQKCLLVTKSRVGAKSLQVAISLHNLATFYNHDPDRYAEAKDLHYQSLEITKKILGYNHIQVALSLSSLAGLYANNEHYKEAETLYIKALEITTDWFGKNHHKVAIILASLAATYNYKEEYDKAIYLLLQAQAIYINLGITQHPELTTCLNNLAYSYFKKGNYDEAEKLFLQVLEFD